MNNTNLCSDSVKAFMDYNHRVFIVQLCWDKGTLPVNCALDLSYVEAFNSTFICGDDSNFLPFSQSS